MSASKSKILTVKDVEALGNMLVEVADRYPTKFLTERDFFPLVVAYLTGRVPGVEAEVATTKGRIDFKLKGTNPTWLELAVQPRVLKDENHPELKIAGGTGKTSLYASQNRPEIQKLMKARSGKTRFLLLVDLQGTYDVGLLMNYYQDETKQIRKGKAINVTYVSRKVTLTKNFRVRV